ncbi:unnamed protein product, partial [marine sediment metagenome]
MRDDVTIGLITWNAFDALKVSYEYHLLNTPKETKFTIIDNNSLQQVGNFLKEKQKDRHFEIKIILNKDNFGFARACNQLFESCETEYLILMNPDIFVVAPDWLDKLIVAFERHKEDKIGLLGCKLV